MLLRSPLATPGLPSPRRTQRGFLPTPTLDRTPLRPALDARPQTQPQRDAAPSTDKRRLTQRTKRRRQHHGLQSGGKFKTRRGASLQYRAVMAACDCTKFLGAHNNHTNNTRLLNNTLGCVLFPAWTPGHPRKRHRRGCAAGEFFCHGFLFGQALSWRRPHAKSPKRLQADGGKLVQLSRAGDYSQQKLPSRNHTCRYLVPLLKSSVFAIR